MSPSPVTTEHFRSFNAASSDFTTIARDDVRWTVRRHWRQNLLDHDAPNWWNLADDPRAECVKTGHRRRVFRVRSIDGGAVYAKVVEIKNPSFADRIRHALGRSASHREWHNTLAAVRRGAPVTQPIALGTRRGGTPIVVYITAAFQGAQNFATAWREALAESDTARRHKAVTRMTRSLADLYADAHNAGFVHLDGHPGNILVAGDGRGAVTARFADAGDAQFFQGHPPWVRIIQSLAHLDHSMRRVATRTQRLRFLRDYLNRLKAPRSYRHEIWMEHSMVASILVMENVHAASLARQRDRRLRRGGKYFTRIVLPHGWRGTFVLTLSRRHVFPELQTPDFSPRRWRDLLDGLTERPENAAQVVQRLTDAGLAVRSRPTSGVLTSVSWRVLGSPDWHDFVRCHALRHRDIVAPLPLAYLERRTTMGGVDRTMLIFVPPGGGL